MHSTKDLAQPEFLARCRISVSDWQKADIEWDRLHRIGIALESRTRDLEDAADLHARKLQRCAGIHAVRWRVKHPEHLMEKVVRKRVQGSDKYAAIDEGNFLSIVSDLIGLRALHLFKEDWEGIHAYVTKNWNSVEDPVAYVRRGDPEANQDAYKTHGCKVEYHNDNYRSVHYVVAFAPVRDSFRAEIQVRTIFEEGWSEIDHHVRYPNHSTSDVLGVFLALFNRIAGSADEMGSFVKRLSQVVRDHDKELADERAIHDRHLVEIESLVAELTREKGRSAATEDRLSELTTQVQALRDASARESNRPAFTMYSLRPDAALLDAVRTYDFGAVQVDSPLTIPIDLSMVGSGPYRFGSPSLELSNLLITPPTAPRSPETVPPQGSSGEPKITHPPPSKPTTKK